MTLKIFSKWIDTGGWRGEEEGQRRSIWMSRRNTLSKTEARLHWESWELESYGLLSSGDHRGWTPGTMQLLLPPVSLQVLNFGQGERLSFVLGSQGRLPYCPWSGVREKVLELEWQLKVARTSFFIALKSLWKRHYKQFHLYPFKNLVKRTSIFF